MLDNEQIALVVHDLKNPLAALVSNLGFVASAVRDDEVTTEAIQDCLLSTEVLSRLIENLATMSSLESNPEQYGDASLPALLSSVEQRMTRHAEASMVALSFRCDTGVAAVEGNGKLLELAIDNLIATSMTHAPSRSVIHVHARVLDEYTTVVSVVDDGPLVEEHVKDLVTRKESQVEIKGAKGGRYGRGLGLYVAALIARTAGGELRIAEPDGRCAFELHLRTKR